MKSREILYQKLFNDSPFVYEILAEYLENFKSDQKSSKKNCNSTKKNLKISKLKKFDRYSSN